MKRLLVLCGFMLTLALQAQTVRVYTEVSGLGHSWISIGEGEEMVLYSFGRYAGSNSEKGKIDDMYLGPAVLLKFIGKDAAAYNRL
jgi:hypothetical protein